MPPKANRRPPIRRPANRLINQQTIELPTTKINNNDGSAYTVKTNKDISAGVNSFFDIIKKDILIVSGGAIVILFLILKNLKSKMKRKKN